MDRRGVSRVSVDFFCLTLPKTFARNPVVLCIRKILAAKKIREYKGVYQDLPSKNCLTVSKNSVGEHLFAVFQKNSGSEIVYG